MLLKNIILFLDHYLKLKLFLLVLLIGESARIDDPEQQVKPQFVGVGQNFRLMMCTFSVLDKRTGIRSRLFVGELLTSDIVHNSFMTGFSKTLHKISNDAKIIHNTMDTFIYSTAHALAAKDDKNARRLLNQVLYYALQE